MGTCVGGEHVMLAEVWRRSSVVVQCGVRCGGVRWCAVFVVWCCGVRGRERCRCCCVVLSGVVGWDAV